MFQQESDRYCNCIQYLWGPYCIRFMNGLCITLGQAQHATLGAGEHYHSSSRNQKKWKVIKVNQIVSISREVPHLRRLASTGSNWVFWDQQGKAFRIKRLSLKGDGVFFWFREQIRPSVPLGTLTLMEGLDLPGSHKTDGWPLVSFWHPYRKWLLFLVCFFCNVFNLRINVFSYVKAYW